MLATYLDLGKPRILALVVVIAMASAVVAQNGSISVSVAISLVLAGGLSSAGAAFLNNYFDRDIDLVMERTRNRPLPLGKVSPKKVLVLGFALLGLSLPVALRINYATALFILGGASIYVGLYTLWLKRRTPFNVIPGGLSGSCAALAGWFASGGEFSLALLMLALLPFFWTPAHFWSFALVHRESYREAGVPMLPVLAGAKKTATYVLLSTATLVMASSLPYFIDASGEIYLVGAAILGIPFLYSSLRLWMQPDRDRAWTHFKLSGIYLFGLYVIMMLDVLGRQT